MTSADPNLEQLFSINHLVQPVNFPNLTDLTSSSNKLLYSYIINCFGKNLFVWGSANAPSETLIDYLTRLCMFLFIIFNFSMPIQNLQMYLF